ncbi:MAG: hypothetical protein QHJ34_00410 [bacterium]|nr:hypothetical protein [candidate division KSB1 bacterium]MDH7558681.1 hypothetical protein [bacterium]
MCRGRLVLFLAVALVGLGVASGSAQLYDGGVGYQGQGGIFIGGLGFASIDGDNYLAFNVRPELSFGKIGVGLNLNLLYSLENGKIRSKDWDTGYDYFRIIRYLRYGRKYDPVYARVGGLDGTRLGHGFIVNYYCNDVNYDERKIGLVFDLDLGLGGFESFTSNLGRAEILGGRAYVRPLRTVTNLPIIKNFAVGASYVTDVDPDGYRGTDDGVAEFGLDAELPLVQTSIFRSTLYADYAKIIDHGSGYAAGIGADLGNLLGLIDVHAKFERRWLGENFLPTYFGPFYEVERHMMSGYTNNPQIVTKVDSLRFITAETKGYFGELYGEILKTVRLVGIFQRLDGEKQSGILHAGAEVPNVPMIAARASYDKIGVETLRDVFTLDKHSMAKVGVGYKIKPYLILFCDYIWTLEWDSKNKVYKPQERVQPSISFVWNFMK